MPWEWDGDDLVLNQDSPGVTGDTIRGATLAPSEKDTKSTMDTGNGFKPAGSKSKKKGKSKSGNKLPF